MKKNKILSLICFFLLGTPAFTQEKEIVEASPALNYGPLQINRYLDSDQRPNAVIVTESKSQVSIDGDQIKFEGQLGAIKGQKSFVGFTGVEVFLAQELKRLKNVRPDSLCLNLDLTSLNANYIMSVELVVDAENGVQKTYLQDVDLKNLSYKIELPLTLTLPFSNFYRSFRGDVTQEVFLKDYGIKKLRIFFRKSLNSPQSYEPQLLSFKIYTNDLDKIFIP